MDRQILSALGRFFLLLASGGVWAGGVGEEKFTPSLVRQLEKDAGPYQVLVTFTPQVLKAWSPEGTILALVRQMDDHLQRVAGLDNGKRGLIEVREGFWVANAALLEVDRCGLDCLAALPEVKEISDNFSVYPAPVRDIRDAGEGETESYGVGLVRAPEAWDRGIKGQGVLIGVIDTGVDGKHPELAGKVVLYRDLFTPANTEPVDKHGHGTHVCGTIAGSNIGSRIGVAPEAKLLVARAIDGKGVEQLLQGLQWMADPDANPATNDFPRIISCSWHTGGAMSDAFYQAIENLNRIGILPVFSAGNNGPRPSSITTPKEHPGIFATGAVDKNGVVADFSSRGPGIYQGKEVKKPEVSAPGVAILSSKPGGGFQLMSGTSMACPHNAGVCALLFSYQPSLTPEAVRLLLQESAVDGGAPGFDYDYGYGRVDVLRALALAESGSWIKGTVVDKVTGQPIAAVPVRVNLPALNKQLTVNAAGRFEALLPAGEYRLTAEAFGYQAWTGTVTLEPSSTLEVPVALAAAPQAACEGFLRAAGSGVPLSGEVAFLDVPVHPVAVGGGQFFVTLPVGTYRIRVLSLGFRMLETGVEAGAGAQWILELQPGTPCLLLDDDGGSNNIENYYQEMLSGGAFEYWPLAEPDLLSRLMASRKVVWFRGTAYGGIKSANARALLRRYLDLGGKVLLTGFGLASSLSYQDPKLMEEYFGCGYASTYYKPLKVALPDGSGIADLGTGTGFNKLYNAAKLQALSGEVLLKYGDPAVSPASILGKKGRGKAILSGFGPEALPTLEQRQAVLNFLLQKLE